MCFNVLQWIVRIRLTANEARTPRSLEKQQQQHTLCAGKEKLDVMENDSSTWHLLKRNDNIQPLSRRPRTDVSDQTF